MLTIFQVPKPCFQGRGVVFADRLTVSDNLSFARDGSPFASGVEESDIDFGFGGEIIGFTGLGICVEKEINAASFLCIMGREVSSIFM